MKQRAVFLDLNGTLVAPVLVERLADLKLIEGVADGIARLCQAGFVCPVVTVQSRIEKGMFTGAEFLVWFGGLARQLAAVGATVVGPYVCPHRFRTPCACKKPQTLLYKRAAADHGLELTASYVVGDSAADIEAAQRFGGRGCFLGSPGTVQGGAGMAAMASHAGRSMTEIVDWIVSRGAAEQPVAAHEARPGWSLVAGME